MRAANLRRKAFVLLAAVCACYGSGAAACQAAPLAEAAALLPESTAWYLEIAAPQQLVEAVATHPWAAEVQQLPQYRQWRNSEQRRGLQLAAGLVELHLGVPWREGLARLAGRGVAVALDADSRGLVLLARAADAEALDKSSASLQRLAAALAQRSGDAGAVTTAAYRGVAVHRWNEVRWAVAGEWLVATNNDRLGQAVLDRLVEAQLASLAAADDFQAALARRGADAAVWTYVDLDALRTAGAAPELLRDAPRDFGGELLLGGALAALRSAPYAAATFDLKDARPTLAVTVPCDLADAAAERPFFFGTPPATAAPPALELAGTVAEIGLFRDVAALWAAAPELFDRQINAQLAKADSDFTTLFGGRPFADEILTGLTGEWRLVCLERQFAEPDDVPTIRLPAFALLTRLRDPNADQRQLRIAFQTAVGFVNLSGVETGRPPLELNTERLAGLTLTTASYADEDAQQANDEAAALPEADLWRNFTPTLGMADDLVVLASTRGAAVDVLQAAVAHSGEPNASHAAERPNALIRLAAAPLQRTLAANRELLIARRILEQGSVRAAAEQHVDGVLAVLDAVDQFALTFDAQAAMLELRLEAIPRSE